MSCVPVALSCVCCFIQRCHFLSSSRHHCSLDACVYEEAVNEEPHQIQMLGCLGALPRLSVVTHDEFEVSLISFIYGSKICNIIYLGVENCKTVSNSIYFC